MSPELLKIYNKSGFGEFNPEKNDIFSLGLSFLSFYFHFNYNKN